MSIYFHQDTLILDRSILIKDMEEIFFKIYIFKSKKLIRFIIANSLMRNNINVEQIITFIPNVMYWKIPAFIQLIL